MTEIFDKIKDIIDNNNVVLFMKGSKDFPQCGFSAMTSHILNNLNIEFTDIDVLQDMNIRQGIKDFSDWPTIPQLYVKGEFIGGCDIVKEMQESGELEELLKEKQIIS
jgi:monothiol glutaredoxin